MRNLPKNGTDWTTLKHALDEAKQDDYDWRGGRLPLYVYYLDDDLLRVATEAYTLYFTENALGMRAFPSLKRLEAEVIEMGLSLFHADSRAGGVFTSGGTESIFLAVKTARDHARAERSNVRRPNLLVPHTAHPTFNKAAHYLGVDVIRVPEGRDFRADVPAMRGAITPETIMLVGSAPSYPHGVFDPIADLGQVALERDLWLHVDACVGGFLAPFVKQLGYEIPPFDFEVPGVTSLSADLHKYGFSAKGASLVLFRDAELKRYLRFEFRDWPRGVYSTETFSGTRAGGAIAAAWAVMNYLGEEGYRRIAGIIMETKARLVAGIQEIDGLTVYEPSDLSIVLYGSIDPAVDINAVADRMAARGWFVGRCLDPAAIHLGLNPVHATVIDSYLTGLRQVVLEARHGGEVGVVDERTY